MTRDLRPRSFALLTLACLALGGSGCLFHRGTPRIAAPDGRPLPRAIAELSPVEINGVQQWLLIRGEDTGKPLLLYLHGGPGAGQIGIFRVHQQQLEKHFVVVQWDQRGAGLSAIPASMDHTMNREQFVADAHELTLHLLRRFGKQKLFLVGHSWGSGLGYLLVHRYPELYAGFAGISQIARRNEERAYQATLDQARQQGNAQAIAALEALGPPPYRNVKRTRDILLDVDPANQALLGMLVRYKWSEVLGGDMKHGRIADLVTSEILHSGEYSLVDALRYKDRKRRSITRTYEECNRDIDLFAEGLDLQVPVFFLLGRYDLLTPPGEAVALFEALRAPRKELFWFDAGHEIPWDARDQYQETLIRVFEGTGS